MVVSSSEAAEIKVGSGTLHSRSPQYRAEITRSFARAQRLVDSLIGIPVRPHFELYVADTKSEFDSLTGGAAPDWGGAVTMPSLGRIVIKTPALGQQEKSLGELVAHEYAHIALHHAVGGPPPRWLDEGFAMLVATEWRFEDYIALASANLFHQLIPLAEIERVNALDAGQAQVAYAECYAVVTHFFEQYGASSFRMVLAELRAGRNQNMALRRAIGVDMHGFQVEAFTAIDARFSFLGAFVDSNVFWMALAGLTVAGFVAARLRRRRRLRESEEEERRDRLAEGALWTEPTDTTPEDGA